MAKEIELWILATLSLILFTFAWMIGFLCGRQFHRGLGLYPKRRHHRRIVVRRSRRNPKVEEDDQ